MQLSKLKKTHITDHTFLKPGPIMQYYTPFLGIRVTLNRIFHYIFQVDVKAATKNTEVAGKAKIVKPVLAGKPKHALQPPNNSSTVSKSKPVSRVTRNKANVPATSVTVPSATSTPATAARNKVTARTPNTAVTKRAAGSMSTNKAASRTPALSNITNKYVYLKISAICKYFYFCNLTLQSIIRI